MKMKGAATWILISGSIMFGLIIFFAGVSLISNQIENAAHQITVDNVANLYNTLKQVCLNEGIGGQRFREISLPENVRAVYVAKSEYAEPPDKVSVYISKRKSAVGNYLCYQLWNENLPKCRKLRCDVNFTYIGTPSLKKDLPSLISRILNRKNPTYHYKLKIQKVKDWHILVEAEPVIGEE